MATVFTIGHSTRTADEFDALLQASGIRTLVDVRRFPGSRRFPQFGREALAGALVHAGIAYIHLPELGGRRAAKPDSRNTAWRNASFRGYADYMDTPEFGAALNALIDKAGEGATAVMCAEAVPWRCHRNLIADALVARGHEVLHILAPGDLRTHTLSSHARVGEDGSIAYPTDSDEQMGLL